MMCGCGCCDFREAWKPAGRPSFSTRTRVQTTNAGQMRLSIGAELYSNEKEEAWFNCGRRIKGRLGGARCASGGRPLEMSTACDALR